MLHQIANTLRDKYTKIQWKLQDEQYLFPNQIPIVVGSLGNSQILIDSWIQLFLEILKENNFTEKLQNTLRLITDSEGHLGNDVITNLLDRQTNKIKRTRSMIGQEFGLSTQINHFEVMNVMLDLGSDVNALSNKSWEALGHPKLVYSRMQLQMDNQYCTYLVGGLDNL